LAAVRENVSIVRAEELFSGYAGFAAKSAGVSIMNCLIFWYHTSGIAVKASNPRSTPERHFVWRQMIQRFGGGGAGSEDVWITS
jgi:hypothetical protein